MPYMTDNPNTAFVVRERVRNGELMQLKALIKEGIDFNECFLAPGPTQPPQSVATPLCTSKPTAWLIVHPTPARPTLYVRPLFHRPVGARCRLG